MKTTINQRVKQIADRLCGGNVSELARVTGIAQPALRDIVGTKQTNPRFEIISKIVECYALQINAEWLITGKGSMHRSNINIVHQSPYTDVGRDAIPIYDISAAMSLQALFANSNQYLLGEIMIPHAPACDGAIYVRGNSVHPTIKSGDMVAYKQLVSLDFLRSDVMYLVDCHINGDEFLVVRYVKWKEKDVTLRLSSSMDQYDDLIIPASGVRAIAAVRVVVRAYW